MGGIPTSEMPLAQLYRKRAIDRENQRYHRCVACPLDSLKASSQQTWVLTMIQTKDQEPHRRPRDSSQRRTRPAGQGRGAHRPAPLRERDARNHGSSLLFGFSSSPALGHRRPHPPGTDTRLAPLLIANARASDRRRPHCLLLVCPEPAPALVRSGPPRPHRLYESPLQYHIPDTPIQLLTLL